MSTAFIHPLPSPARFPPDSPESPGRHSPPNPWPTLDEAALYGLPGRVVATLRPHTEADPAALLATFLASFGSAANSGPHAWAEGIAHPGRLFVVIVGQSSRARKGSSWKQVQQVMRRADPDWADGTVSGLASGEGLIKAAAGTRDSRVFVLEGEYVRLLKTASRDGSTLSPVLREAWDSGDMRVTTKNEPLSVKGAHVSLLGHITFEELQSNLTSGEATNGFANRFLFVCAKRSDDLLPFGGNLDEQVIGDLGATVANRLGQARKMNRLTFDAAAMPEWERIYHEIADDDPSGLLGSLLGRAEAQVLRLSVIYAITDGERRISPQHLEAAYAFWHYCRASVAHTFGDRLGNPDAERVLDLLAASTRGMLTKQEIRDAFANHLSQSKLDAALVFLEDRNRIKRVIEKTRGRPRTLIVLV